MFFAISGYLVTQSLLRSNKAQFAIKRAARIFPALALVVVFSVFVIGPIFTTISKADYFTSSLTYYYFINVALFPIYYLNGTFTDLPVPNALNGSIWSLPVEVASYLLIALVVYKGRSDNQIRVVLLLLAVLGWHVFATLNGLTFIWYGTEWFHGMGLQAHFLIGALFALLDRRWFRLDLALVAVLINPLFQGVEQLVYSTFALTYVVISFGLASTPFVRRAGRFGDPSYGAYLWAFPVQQILVHLNFADRDPYPNILAVTVLSFGLGYVSWHFLEKHVMKFAKRYLEKDKKIIRRSAKIVGS